MYSYSCRTNSASDSLSSSHDSMAGKQRTVVQNDGSPESDHDVSDPHSCGSDAVTKERSWKSSVLMVVVGGLALFSDGYNAQVVGYMNPVLTELYPDDYTPSMKTRMSNAFLIGEIFGMLFFGWAIDKLGRRNGIIWATTFLVLGIILTTAAHGTTNSAMIWMMITGRGVAGFGAGGECAMVLCALKTH